MSKARPDLANDTGTLIKVIESLASIPQVEEIWLAGSRSPMRKRQVKPESDWDLVVTTRTKNLKLPRLREWFKFHADLLVLDLNLGYDMPHDMVQLYPVDTHSILQDNI